jgi:hypothetical protein
MHFVCPLPFPERKRLSLVLEAVELVGNSVGVVQADGGNPKGYPQERQIHSLGEATTGDNYRNLYNYRRGREIHARYGVTDVPVGKHA